MGFKGTTVVDNCWKKELCAVHKTLFIPSLFIFGAWIFLYTWNKKELCKETFFFKHIFSKVYSFSGAIHSTLTIEEKIYIL